MGTITRTRCAPLKFGQGNGKLDAAVFTFGLPAGHFCPFANECKAKADRATGRIRDGANTVYRCYAASVEARPVVRMAYWHNADLLRACKTTKAMMQLILDSLSPFAGYVRLHVGGDFYSQSYFDAWLEVARRRPRTWFYGYTKALSYWVRRRDALPGNFLLTASFGGTHDYLIARHGLRYARVVFSEAEAAALGLELDHDDSHAMNPGPSFALLIYGSQPARIPAAKAIAALRAQGEYGYGEKAAAARGRLSLQMAV